VTLTRVRPVISRARAHEVEATRGWAVAVVQLGQGVEEFHRPLRLHQANSDEVGRLCLVAADLMVRVTRVGARQARAAVGSGLDLFQLHRRTNRPRQSQVSVTGPEEETAGMNSAG
jgi:hypothetical protein